MRDIMPNPDCEKCSGDGGWYWDSPGESNDRVREWMSCDCWIECREEAPELYHVNGALVRCFLHADGGADHD